MDSYLKENHRNTAYLTSNSEQVLLTTEDDIMDLLVKIGEYEVDKVLLYHYQLDPAFFDLKSGLLGVLLQKCVTYRIQLAIVIPYETITDDRIKELIYEANQRHQYRFYNQKDEALEWFSD